MPGAGSEGEQVDREARVKPFELGWKVKDTGFPCSQPLLCSNGSKLLSCHSMAAHETLATEDIW